MEKQTMSALAIVKEYFELSNSRKLEAVAELLAEDATYSSDNTGLYFGKNDIMAMMDGFYDSFPYLNWSVQSLEEKTEHIVEAGFTLFAKNQDGTVIEKPGKESVIVVDGKIRHVEVRNL